MRPACFNKNTNEAAEPSMMGISSAVKSTIRLSIPNPAHADSRCSTVDTRTPSFSSTDAMRVSPTPKADAGNSTTGSRSTRRNTMPVSTAAGRRLNSTRVPQCRPTPVVVIACSIVRCLIMIDTVACRSVRDARNQRRASFFTVAKPAYSCANIVSALDTSNLPAASTCNCATTPSLTSIE